jgi:hypothetical protein
VSNALAIASVTAVLKDLLDNGLIDRNVSSTIGGPVTISALPPDRVKTGTSDPTQLNLFLYHVMPNPGWRNVDQPSRNGRGERLSNPPLALDLFYLLTAYGKQDFEAEILLGYAMQLLHETPVLTRSAIRRSLSPTSPVGGGGLLPPPLNALPASELADQVELIKLTLQPTNTEETSKLWSAIQSNYRPSVAYQASVVLVEGTRPARSPLPVLKRGSDDRAPAVEPDPTAPLPSFPILLAVTPPNRQPGARLGDLLEISGHNLGGNVTVRFTHPLLATPISLAPQPGGTATALQVRIPDAPADPQAPANWPAGFYTVAAAVGGAGQPAQTTNEAALALAPTILTISPNPAARDANGRVTLTVTCKPQVRPAQRASLFLNDREVPAQPHPSPTGTLTFRVDAASPGQHRVRLRVDGVDSLLVDRSVSPPVFVANQSVTIT